MPEGQSSPIPSNGIFQPGEDLSKQLVEEAARVLAEETARIASHVSQMEGQGDEGSVSYNSGYTGSGYSHAASDTERMLEEMAEAQVYEAMEEELSEELQCEANSISYGNAHRPGID